MDVADVSFALPLVLLALLAIILANIIFGKKDALAPPSETQSEAPVEKERRGREGEADVPAPALRADGGKGAGAEDNGEERTSGGGQLGEAEEQNTVPARRRARTDGAGRQGSAQGSPETGGEGDHKSASEVQTVFPKTTSSARDLFQDVLISAPVPAKVALCHLALERDAYAHHFPGVEVHEFSPESDPEPGLEENLAEYSPENEDDEDMIAVGTEAEDLSLRYALGKLRTAQLEEMMTKEEVQEEQRKRDGRMHRRALDKPGACKPAKCSSWFLLRFPVLVQFSSLFRPLLLFLPWLRCCNMTERLLRCGSFLAPELRHIIS
ncbi:uncharacterized protein LOC108940104 [Arapaima gigas]